MRLGLVWQNKKRNWDLQFPKMRQTLTATTTALSFLPCSIFLVDEFSTLCKIFSIKTAPLDEFHVPI